jgi:AcrR family transcriptional regulator
MGRPKAPTFDLQRAAIVESAAHLFAQKGFHNASMAQLARSCAISKPLLYHYYRDKEQILFDVADRYLDRLLAIAAEVRAQQLLPEAQLRTLVGRFMQEYRHSQAQHMVLVQDVKFLGEAQRAQVVSKQRQVVEAFTAAIDRLRPRLRQRGVRVPLTMVLFGMINWTFTWLRPDGELTYDDMAEVVSDIFLHGVAS